MHLLRLASEFGLTPAAEQRLAVAPGDDGDGLNPFARPVMTFVVLISIEFGIFGIRLTAGSRCTGTRR